MIAKKLGIRTLIFAMLLVSTAFASTASAVDNDTIENISSKDIDQQTSTVQTISLSLSNENIDISTKENSNDTLQKAVENYNQIVVNKNSSWDDVTKCTNQIDLIVDNINKLGMDVDFKQTSDVHVNNKDETLPACISADITPYMLSQSYNFATNESTSAVLADVYRTNITVAEYLEKVFPESLKVLPKDAISRYQKTPMTWPNSKETESGKKQTISTESSGFDTINIQAISPSESISTVYTAESVSSQTLKPTNNPPSASFKSYTQMSLPTQYTRIPEISVNSYMYKDGDTTP